MNAFMQIYSAQVVVFLSVSPSVPPFSDYVLLELMLARNA